MRFKSTLFVAALMASTAFITAQVVSQEKKEKPRKGYEAAPAQQEGVPEWTKYTMPGEHHKHLEPFVGKWTYSIEMWEHSESEPMTSTGDVEYKWILDGHFVLGHYTGMYMDMPFERQELMGYDNFRGEHISLWIDNHATSFTTSTGKYDENSRTFTHKGKTDDVMSGQKNKPFKTIIRLEGDDTFVMEWTTPGEDGGMFKAMNLVATRQP